MLKHVETLVEALGSVPSLFVNVHIPDFLDELLDYFVFRVSTQLVAL